LLPSLALDLILAQHTLALLVLVNHQMDVFNPRIHVKSLSVMAAHALSNQNVLLLLDLEQTASPFVVKLEYAWKSLMDVTTLILAL
jgi:hypothetical protein